MQSNLADHPQRARWVIALASAASAVSLVVALLPSHHRERPHHDRDGNGHRVMGRCHHHAR